MRKQALTHDFGIGIYPNIYAGFAAHGDQDCLDDACLNGGTCYDRIDGYICACTPAYTGLSCETRKPLTLCYHGEVKNQNVSHIGM